MSSFATFHVDVADAVDFGDQVLQRELKLYGALFARLASWVFMAGGGFMVFACPFDRRLELERVLSEAGVQMRPFSFTTLRYGVSMKP